MQQRFARSIYYRLVAFTRFLAFHAFRADMVTRDYDTSHPDSPAQWYRGWIEADEFGTVAFVKNDGRNQYRW